MIITCPNCHAKFSLADDALPPEGHDVRCSSCGHVWFQSPADAQKEIVSGEKEPSASGKDELDDMDLEDVMAAAERPDDDDSDEGGAKGKSAQGSDEAGAQDKNALIGGYAAAAGVFVFVLLFLLMIHGPMARAIPGMQPFYGAFGISFPAPGKGLVFDKVITKTEPQGKGQERIYVEGNIINLTSKAVRVPMMQVTLLTPQGDVAGQWLATPPEDTIQAESTLSFQAGYDNQNLEVNEARLRFVLDASAKSKTDKAPSSDKKKDKKDDQKK